MVLVNGLSSLPSEIISEIFGYLPDEYIKTFLNFPKLRTYAIEALYTEIHYIPSEPRVHNCDKRTHIYYADELINLFRDNLDVIPNKLSLIAGRRYQGIKQVMGEAREILLKIPHLEFTVERYNLTQQDYDELLSFPNVDKINFSLTELDDGFALKLPSKLNEFILLGQSFTTLENIDIPENLESLDISYNERISKSGLRLPPRLKGLYLNLGDFDNDSMQMLPLPDTLENIMMTYNTISELRKPLPENLRILDFSNNTFEDISNISWPMNLKSMILTGNMISDIRDVKWPPTLLTLRLDSNHISQLDSVSLPNSITYLDLSSNEIRAVDGFTFPCNLSTLNMAENEAIDYEKLQFPSGITSLNLDECNISNLGGLKFPDSLKILSLSGNKIKEVKSYIWPEKLECLELFHNWIMSVDNWETPANLKYLNLSSNRIQKVNNFKLSEYLEELDLSDNFIYSFLGELPISIRSLKLSRNRLNQLTNGFRVNSKLEDLLLDDNYIRKLNVELNPGLKRLDLTGNSVKFDDLAETVKGTNIRLTNKNANKNHI